jgi:hypothetical protein
MSDTLLARIAARFSKSRTVTCRETRPGELALTLADDRREVLVIEQRRDREHTVVLLAWICHERNADPSQMLRLVGHMGAGAIALVGHAYVVRYTIPAAQLEAAPLDQLVPYLRTLALAVGDDLESRRAVATEAIGAFEHLAI